METNIFQRILCLFLAFLLFCNVGNFHAFAEEIIEDDDAIEAEELADIDEVVLTLTEENLILEEPEELLPEEETEQQISKSESFLIFENLYIQLISSPNATLSHDSITALPREVIGELQILLDKVTESFANLSPDDEAIFYCLYPTGLETLLALQSAVDDSYSILEASEIHDHDGITFSPWTTPDSLPLQGGSYYLDTDVTLSAVWKVSSSVNLCLNGHKIVRTGTGSAISVSAGSALNIYDCNGINAVYRFNDTVISVISGTVETKWVLSEDEFYKHAVAGGIITGGSYTANASQITNISRGGGGINNAGTLNMYGGSVVGNTVNYGAGKAICGGGILNTGTFNMYGGNICGNCAYSTDKTGNTYGGGVCSTGNFNFYGGNIYGNASFNTAGAPNGNGGGVAVMGGTFYAAKSTEIFENLADGNGGGVYIYKTSDNKTECAIANNRAAKGGGVYLNTGSSLSTSASISGNTSTGDGGGVYVISGSTLNVYGASIISGNGTSDILLNNGKTDILVSVGNLTAGASMGIFSKKLPPEGGSVALTSGYTQNTGLSGTDYFFCNNEGYTLKNIGGELAAVVREPVYITLDPNGGSCGETTLPAGADGRVTGLPTPTRENHDFLGWFTQKEGGNGVTADTVFAESTTIYARWELILQEQAAPTSDEFEITAETFRGKNDGSIIYKGTSSAPVEYKNSDGVWTALPAGGLSNLAPGSYTIRYGAYDIFKPSSEIALTVAEGGKIAITLPDLSLQTNYTVTAQPAEVEYNGKTRITVIIGEGFGMDSGFAVKSNGVTLTHQNITDDYTVYYDISDIKDNLTITVEGVADIHPPVGKLTVGGREYTGFLFYNNMLYFSLDQNVTLTAEDKGSGIEKKLYLISGTPLTMDTLKAYTEDKWTEYSDSFSLSEDGEYYIYSKLADNCGNTAFLGAQGVVIDKTPPTLSVNGISPDSNNRIYIPRGEGTAVITEDNLSAATLDGAYITGSSFAVPYDENTPSHTVTLTDLAGNTAEFTVKYTREGPKSEDFTVTAETVLCKGDGSITYTADTADSLEYCGEDGAWHSFSGKTANGLASVKYLVRLAGTADYPPSDPVNLTVGQGVPLKVTLKDSNPGYSVEIDPENVAYNGKVTVTITLSEGFTCPAERPISARGDAVTGNIIRDGNKITAEISGIKADTVINIDGIKDSANPSAKIDIGDKNYINITKAPVDLYYKDAASFDISGDDKGSGLDKLYYCVTKSIPADITDNTPDTFAENAWIEVTGGKVEISDEGRYLLFVKAVDKFGNKGYASTDIIVIDKTAPTLTVEGIKSDENNILILPREDVSFTVDDSYFDKIFVNGDDVTEKLEGKKYTVKYDEENTAFEVVLSDLAGNESKYKLEYEPLPPGEITVGVDVGEGVPDFGVPTLTAELAAKEFTEDELDTIEKGKNARVYFEVSYLTALSPEEEALANNLISGIIAGVPLDISLYKQIGSGEPTKITKAANNYQFTMKIPKDLIVSGDAITRMFKLIKIHNGVASIVPIAIRNDVISFNSDEFSTYVLGYTQVFHVTNIAVSPQKYTLIKSGEQKKILCALSPSTVSNKGVVWSSSNNKIATVNSKGVVTAVSNGQVKIKATAVDGGKSAEAIVTVNLSYQSRYPRTGDSNHTNLWVAALATSAAGFCLSVAGLKRKKKKA